LPEVNDEFNHTQRSDYDDLRGKTAVVTGSSSGIGEAISRQLATAGAAVYIHGHRHQESVERVSGEIRAIGRESAFCLADLAHPPSVDAFAERAWEWRDGVDIWINNAGADVLTGTAADWPFEKKLDQLWKVDVLASIRLSRIIGQRMKNKETQPGSVILNIGWDQAAFGMGGDSGEMFAASKGAVMAFSRSLAKSLAPDVRVNCLAPGWIKTAWGDEASEYWQQRAKSESLVNRWGSPDDVARAALFLVSPASAFISGQVLPVNGGR